MMDKKIVLLAGRWNTTPIVFNFLQKNFSIEASILEDPVPKKEFLKKRIRKLGSRVVAGQVLFQLLVARPLGLTSKRRIQEIVRAYELDEQPISYPIQVPSVNSSRCLEVLKKLKPDLVVVHGTRIISKKLLQEVNCPFINIHAGITPRYRGSHGAYWALANSDKENCGVTVHLVDAGIDTGNVLFQQVITITQKDNFITYPYLQLAEGLKLLRKAIPLLFEGKAEPVKKELDSALWHHPTLWGYLSLWLRKGVK
jgi:folate-dependent phosphoribosylglycinamide formyltransferase PurN